jgi:hypothetical protein
VQLFGYIDFFVTIDMRKASKGKGEPKAELKIKKEKLYWIEQ